MTKLIILALVLQNPGQPPQVKDLAVARDMATCQKLAELVQADPARPANIEAVCRVVKRTEA